MEIPASILQMKEKRVMIAFLVNQNRKSKKIKTLEEIDSINYFGSARRYLGNKYQEKETTKI
ncbi:MAG: hypothetical protein IIA19_09155 [Thaumarchaeota archaeon]|nr:hypothetical protein [Nitrososphaerota archaeon]